MKACPAMITCACGARKPGAGVVTCGDVAVRRGHDAPRCACFTGSTSCDRYCKGLTQLARDDRTKDVTYRCLAPSRGTPPPIHHRCGCRKSVHAGQALEQ